MSRQARTDLRAVSDFIASDDPAPAVSFFAALRIRCPALGRQPMSGRPASEIAPNVRILKFRSYLIHHRKFDDRISIDRGPHAAGDRSALPPHE
ncbi:type II toxin-antitoxin system RelE/ParE family toxin [Methylobacterium sp. NEAU K]|uniref:type II toxin-antitoxin system RelE/ParE family toxin n=1 Tax=Methylobacterium sp. NEAU K TaxID=3064946 RepID=UPI00351E326F